MTRHAELEIKIAVLESTEKILWDKAMQAKEVYEAARKEWAGVHNELADAQREREIESLVAARLCGVDA